MTEQEEYKKNFFSELIESCDNDIDTTEIDREAEKEKMRKRIGSSNPSQKKAKRKPIFDYYDPKFRKIRLEALLWYGEKCMQCGAIPSDSVYMTIDHIKPVSKFPELAMDKMNMQILCMKCNRYKSNRHCGDFRGL